MSDKTERPREFQPVESPLEAKRLLEEACKTLASTMIWTRNQDNVVRTYLTLYSDARKELRASKPKDLDVSKFIHSASQSRYSDCYFSVSLSISHALVFFKARFVGTESGDLEFRFPDNLYKVQRRKDLRLQLPEESELKVELNDPFFEGTTIIRKIIDISAAGLAFYVNEDEADNFQPGQTLKKLTIMIRSQAGGAKAIETDATVRHVKRLPSNSPRKGSKVGVMFNDIRPGDAQHIATFVFEENRKYFSKFI